MRKKKHINLLFCPPDPYFLFLSEFSVFFSDSELKKDIVMVCFFIFYINAHAGSESLNIAFKKSVGFTQNVNKPTHSFHHTLDLILTCDRSNYTSSQSIFFTNLQVNIDWLNSLSKFYYIRCLLENIVATLNTSLPLIFSFVLQSSLNDYSCQFYKQVQQCKPGLQKQFKKDAFFFVGFVGSKYLNSLQITYHWTKTPIKWFVRPWNRG